MGFVWRNEKNDFKIQFVMRKLGIVLAALVLAVAVSSCANRKVSRVDAGEVIDLSGNWNLKTCT